MRTPAYADPNHPDHQATQAAVTAVYQRLYPEGR
jgi:LmbE family N-acetylglucosaminyl deacetylase